MERSRGYEERLREVAGWLESSLHVVNSYNGTVMVGNCSIPVNRQQFWMKIVV